MPGGDTGALSRVGVERLQAGARADLELADVLVHRLDVMAAVVDREGDDQPAGHVALVRAGGGREQPELLAPASRYDGVQPLHHRLGADLSGDLGAAERVVAIRDLGHGAEADRPRRERTPEQRGGVQIVRAGSSGLPLVFCMLSLLGCGY